MGRLILVILCLLISGKNFSATATIYNCRDYGVKGNGTSDDGIIIQEILDQKGPGVTVFLPAGIYLLRQPLLIRNNNVSLVGESPDKTILLFRPEKFSATGRQIPAAIQVRGLMEFIWFPVNLLTIGKENFLETDRAQNFSPGDILEIASDLSETDFRRQKYYLARVEKTSGNRIVLNEPLPEEFSSGSNCRIRRCLIRKNITLENFTLQVENLPENNFCGVLIEIAENINLKNLLISGFPRGAIHYQQVYESRISSCAFTIARTYGRFHQNRALYLTQSNKIIVENNRSENYSQGILLNHFNFNYRFSKNTFINCRTPVYDREKPGKNSFDW